MNLRDVVPADESRDPYAAAFHVGNSCSTAFYDREFGATQLRELPGVNLMDLNIRSLGLTEWEFKAGVLNLFDRPHEYTVGYPEPQRTFYVSALKSL